jgi:hypothetical protein
VQEKARFIIRRARQFFRLGLAQESLENMFRTNFALMQFHNYGLDILENMLPWERAIYVEMLAAHIQEENLKENMRRVQAQSM